MENQPGYRHAPEAISIMRVSYAKLSAENVFTAEKMHLLFSTITVNSENGTEVQGHTERWSNQGHFA